MKRLRGPALMAEILREPIPCTCGRCRGPALILPAPESAPRGSCYCPRCSEWPCASRKEAAPATRAPSGGEEV